MTPDQLRAARATLAKLWDLPAPLTYMEMGRVLRLAGSRPDQSIRDYERGTTKISGPLTLAIEAMLSGWRPDDLAETLPEAAQKPVQRPGDAHAANLALQQAQMEDALASGYAREIAKAGTLDLPVGPIPRKYGSRLKTSAPKPYQKGKK